MTEGGLFETRNAPSIYRNGVTPNQTVDDAWEQLEYIRVFPITETQVRKLGKDPEWAVKFPSEYGLGENVYMGQIVSGLCRSSSHFEAKNDLRSCSIRIYANLIFRRICSTRSIV